VSLLEHACAWLAEDRKRDGEATIRLSGQGIAA
jgi:hypothetical protein